MKKRTARLLTVSAVVLAAGLGFAALVYFGVLWPNDLFAAAYPVRGIDVSNHQKVVDWEAVAREPGVDFAFLKATEGDDYRDRYFASNWKAAGESGILRGAYHFFTTASSGARQAANFIAVVPVEPGSLPPVVDIETGGIAPEDFRRELQAYLDLVETNYGQKPILYTVYALYDEYLEGGFEGYPVWIRDIVKPPALGWSGEWLFWQYGNRGRVAGIAGYVDRNAFAGSREELEALLSK